jgi:hypothetical protein
MHIYIFSFLNICYNNDRKFKYFFRNNHPTIHTNLYIFRLFFFRFLYQTMFGFFTLLLDLNVNGEHCGQSLNKKKKKFLEMLRKLVYPFKNDIFFCYHQIYKSLMTKNQKVEYINSVNVFNTSIQYLL